MGDQPSAVAAAPAFEASGLLMAVTGLFAFAHALTGLAALFLEMDLLQGTLLDTGSFKKAPVLKKGSWAEFLRGPKRNGPEKAPNVRAWGARQASLSVPYWTALVVGDKLVYQVAFMCLFSRICGDILQNLIDGCMWKARCPSHDPSSQPSPSRLLASLRPPLTLPCLPSCRVQAGLFVSFEGFALTMIYTFLL